MSYIVWEIYSCLISASVGVFLAAEYDILRILRRVIIHRRRWVRDFEDILYGINAGLVVFAVTYKVNYGIMRGFFVMSIIAGVVIYKNSLSNVLVELISKIFVFALKPLKKLTKLIRIKRKPGTNAKKGKSDEA